MITCLLPLLFMAWPTLPPPEPPKLWEVQGPRTIYYWYSADCAICGRQSPIVDRLHGEGWPIFRTDADTVPNRRLAEGYGIDAAPTFSVFVGGREIARHVGFRSYYELREWMGSRGTRKRVGGAVPPASFLLQAPRGYQPRCMVTRSGGG